MEHAGETGQPPTDGPVRLTRADPSAVFEQLERSGLIERGGVNIIGLDSVRERLRARWPRKREVVWEHLEGAARRRLGPADFCLRLSETDYAIAITDSEPVAAQAACLRVLGEVLEHFLGDCRTEEMVIRAVTSVKDGEIACTPLDPAAIQRAASTSTASTQSFSIREKTRFHEQPFILTSMGGRDLKLKHDFEPLLSLATGRAIATTLEPCVIDVASGRRIPGYAFGRLSDPDLWSIDRLTLELAQQAAVQGYPPQPLVLPISYQSLSGSRCRSRLVELLSCPSRPRLVVEIGNVGAGTPPGWLAELAGMMKQMDVGVFVRLPPGREALAALMDARPSGVVMDAEAAGGRRERLPDLMTAFAGRAQGMAPVLAVRGLPDEALLGQAKSCGFTHAGSNPDAALTLAA